VESSYYLLIILLTFNSYLIVFGAFSLTVTLSRLVAIHVASLCGLYLVPQFKIVNYFRASHIYFVFHEWCLSWLWWKKVLHTCGRLPFWWEWQWQWLRLEVLHPFHGAGSNLHCECTSELVSYVSKSNNKNCFTFLYYPSQHNYQNLVHVAYVKWVYWWYSLLHVSAHRTIISHSLYCRSLNNICCK
jgi:hypothetical protein